MDEHVNCNNEAYFFSSNVMNVKNIMVVVAMIVQILHSLPYEKQKELRKGKRK